MIAMPRQERRAYLGRLRPYLTASVLLFTAGIVIGLMIVSSFPGLGDYFEQTHPAPTMLMVYQVRRERRAEIPAVTHVDGSGRLQTVSREVNSRYYQLISDFAKLTGVPVLLNTSFNENEPIVCTPEHAIDCFLKTRMDALYIGNHVVRRMRDHG